MTQRGVNWVVGFVEKKEERRGDYSLQVVVVVTSMSPHTRVTVSAGSCDVIETYVSGLSHGM